MFFPQEVEDNMTFLYESLLPVNQSAFVDYSNRPRNEGGRENHCIRLSAMNMNKRMIEFLRRSWPGRVGNGLELEKEKCYRHMMSERMRREKEKQGFSALHAMLPMGTKNDKKSIVQIATMKLQQMQKDKEELWTRNTELERILGSKEREMDMGTMINLKVKNPASGVDSMVEVLKFLKQSRLQTRSIQSVFSPKLFSAQLQIQTEIGGAEVEEAMQRTLYEAERKHRSHFQESEGA
ncbi:hypothetical protein FNV43_RR01519 [Rhamnella rubrinervis]|uniref:BHLH domain-containing protein n=1 Tax=Rhamnella rubrinervis TaxID=2594499 RepID=A0A8K0HQM2_9ROSA|nr:hypothetical protein FNV43_RR01519 [Rhamnella rubrinervis]